MLAHEVAKALNKPIIEWHIKSTIKAQQGLYEYDAVSRLRDSQLGDERVKDIAHYIKKGKLWEAFTQEAPPAGYEALEVAMLEVRRRLAALGGASATAPQFVTRLLARPPCRCKMGPVRPSNSRPPCRLLGTPPTRGVWIRAPARGYQPVKNLT